MKWLIQRIAYVYLVLSFFVEAIGIKYDRTTEAADCVLNPKISLALTRSPDWENGRNERSKESKEEAQNKSAEKKKKKKDREEKGKSRPKKSKN